MNRDLLYLQHIRDAADKIRDYVAVGRDVFMSESHWFERCLGNHST